MVCVKWFLNVVLVCIFLISHDKDHFFIVMDFIVIDYLYFCFCDIWLFMPFAYFFYWVVFFLLIHSIYLNILGPLLITCLQISSPIIWVIFSCSFWYFGLEEIFGFNEVEVSIISFMTFAIESQGIFPWQNTMILPYNFFNLAGGTRIILNRSGDRSPHSPTYDFSMLDFYFYLLKEISLYS